jgi:pimeloyl-ACP methyl ester carboxylesterase
VPFSWQESAVPRIRSDDGIELHYEALGESGSPVLMLQGIGVSARHWGRLPERILAGDPNRYRLLLPDNRCSGRSGIPWRPFGMRRLADDALAVLDHAGAEKALVVGISMGGMIAQELALRHPERVSGLLLASTTPGFLGGVVPGLRSLWTILRFPFIAERWTPEDVLHVSFFYPRERAAVAARIAEVMEYWVPLQRAEKMSLRAFLLQSLAAFSHSTWRRLPGLRVPTAVIAGVDDLFVSARNSELLARRIPGASLTLIPDCGHALPIDAPDLIPRLVDELREAATRPAGAT